MKQRRSNKGLRKLCTCSRRNWAKCAHPWHFNFKLRGGSPHRFSLDVEVGRHLKTKEEAETAADAIRSQIRAGTFVRAADRRKTVSATPLTADATTFAAFAEKYVDDKAKASGKTTWKNDQHMLNRLAAFTLADGSRFGDQSIGAVTEDTLERFYTTLRATRAASTCNQYVQVMKAAFRWAAKKGYLTRSPISEDAALTRTKIAQRSRRLVPDVLNKDGTLKEPGEERRLLAAAGPGLQRLIIAALETGCRRGELLSLQWADVNLERGELRIRAETAKDAETRILPISPRLRGVLQMAKVDPAGKDYKPEHFVFGVVGTQVANVKRAWETAVLKAHGYTPVWIAGTLAAESRAQIRAIDLHFHDLRHEAGSRLLEAGWPIHHVKEMLGHANITQTDTYLNAGRMGLHDSMQRFAGNGCNPVAIAAESGHPTDRNKREVGTEQVTVN